MTAVGDGTYIVDGRKECEISSYKGVSGDISYYAKMPDGMDKVALSVVKDAKDWGKDGIMVFANSLDAMRNKLRKVFAAWDKQQPSTAAAEAEEKQTPVAAAIASAEAETDQNPTDAQKEAADAAESTSLHALREHVRTLAEEMDVKLPENFDTMTEEQLRNALDRGEEMKKGRERLAAAKYKVGDKVRDTNGHELEVVRVYIVREEPVNGVVEHTVYYDLKEGKKKPFAQPERNLDMWQEMNEQRAEADAKRQRQNTEETVDEPAADATGTGAESAEPAGEAAVTEAEPAADAVGTVAEPTGETVGTEADGTTGKQQRKRKVKQKEDIEDVGEKIAGARKDMKLEIAKSIDDATVQSLIELAFSKAYKKPNLAKAVESGALREKDATFYDAWFNTTINQTKPKLTQRDSRMKKWRADYVTPVERWAQSTYERLQFLKEFVEADEEKRDEMMDRVLSDKYLNVDADSRKIAMMQSMNPHLPADTWGECWTPNPMVITYEVMERLGYKVGDKLDIPFGMLQPNSHFTSYSLTNAKGDRPYDATVLSLEDGINRIVSMAKLKR